MRKIVGVSILVFALSAVGLGQVKRAVSPSAKPTPKPAPAKYPAAVPAADGTAGRGGVSGRTYSNRAFGFEITFPDEWLIPGDDFETEMKKAGFDLGLSAPSNVGSADRIKMNRALQNVNILLTAYRSMPGSADNSIVRVSVEDLRVNPQIRDAIDYFDAMRNQFKSMRLPADFKYSETGAEQLGKQQFAYLDSSSSAGKKRLYATVRNGHAILFSISYTRDEDLQVLRKVLSEGNFALK